MGFRKDVMKNNYQTVNNLKVSSELLKFVNEELLKNTDNSVISEFKDFKFAPADIPIINSL